MITKDRLLATSLLFSLFLISCTTENQDQGDIINDPYTSAQAEVREAINSIVKDAEMANIDGLQAAHLHSDKFTKFGPRNFERQDVESTNKSEAAFFGSISEYKQEILETFWEMIFSLTVFHMRAALWASSRPWIYRHVFWPSMVRV